jgi:acyl carrier protein
MDMLQSIREIFEENLKLKLDRFDAETSPSDIDAWDSTAHVSLVLAIESRFSLQFTPIELGRLSSVGAIRDIVEAKLRPDR